MGNRIRFIIKVISVFAIIVAWCMGLLITRIPETPERALKDFYTKELAEDQIMDPLILAGSDVVPLLIKEIKNRNMPKRRYAIGAIGNIGGKAAIPTLVDILNDNTEENYFRCDALNSISMIDFQRAKQLATKHKENTSDCLEKLSEALLTEDSSMWHKITYMRRSYLQALLGRHE